MHAALVIGDGVNFIDNHRFHIAQDGAALLRRQQNVERLGRGDENVRRPLQHQAPVFHQRVARANRGANLRHQQAAIGRHLQNFPERHFEIFLNVVAEGLEGRNVENFGAVAQLASQRFADETVNTGQKSGQRFARSGGSRDQRSMAGKDVRPTLLLRFGRRREARREPFLNQWMRPGKRGGDCGRHKSYCK